MILFLFLEELGKMERECSPPRREGRRVLNVDAFASVTDKRPCPVIYDQDCRAHMKITTHTDSRRPTVTGLGGWKERFPKLWEVRGSWSFCRGTRRI